MLHYSTQYFFMDLYLFYKKVFSFYAYMFHGMNKLNLAGCWKYRITTMDQTLSKTNLQGAVYCKLCQARLGLVFFFLLVCKFDKMWDGTVLNLVIFMHHYSVTVLWYR